MFHPVGQQPPSVYWRRRLTLLATIGVVLVLLVVTARVLFGGGGARPAGAGAPLTDSAGGAPSSTAGGTATRTSSRPSTPHSTSAARPPSSTASSSSRSATSTTAGTVQRCTSDELDVRAVSDQTSYHVGDTPKLMLQVIDKSTARCVQDLADAQIELLVFNGASRVWGSHDCKVLPGTHDMTLVPGAPVRITVVWSGLSSQPGCGGTRQLVGAGTYTLYAKLSGKTGVASQFSIS